MKYIVVNIKITSVWDLGRLAEDRLYTHRVFMWKFICPLPGVYGESIEGEGEERWDREETTTRGGLQVVRGKSIAVACANRCALPNTTARGASHLYTSQPVLPPFCQR